RGGTVRRADDRTVGGDRGDPLLAMLGRAKQVAAGQVDLREPTEDAGGLRLRSVLRTQHPRALEGALRFVGLPEAEVMKGQVAMGVGASQEIAPPEARRNRVAVPSDGVPRVPSRA